MALHQVQQGVQEDPDEVDEVPVQRGDLQMARRLPRRARARARSRAWPARRCLTIMCTACSPVITKYSAKNCCAPATLQRERGPGHEMLVPVGVPLDPLDRHERHAEHRCHATAAAPPTARARACSAQATASATSALLVSSSAVLTVPSATSVSARRRSPAFRPRGASIQVGEEQPAEEQHLAGQEDPHAQLAGVGIGGLVAESAWWQRSWRGLRTRARRHGSRRRCPAPLAACRSCASAAASASATPGPWRAERVVAGARAASQRPGEVDQRQQVADRQHAGAGRREQVEHLELRRIRVIAARHALDAQQELREEGQVEADEHEHRGDARPAPRGTCGPSSWATRSAAPRSTPSPRRRP